MQDSTQSKNDLFSGRVFMSVSGDKAFSMFVFLTLLAGASAIFLIVNNLSGFLSVANEYITRQKANLTYSLFYKEHAEAPLVSGEASAIPVLLYHGEGSTSDMPTEKFVGQLHALFEAGWTTISMKQFEDFMRGGTTLPSHSFLLTFDDGRKDTFYNSDPVLKDLGYTAVMFVITGFSLPPGGSRSTYYLNERELAYMKDSGRWDLQSHGDEDHRIFQVQSTTDLALKAVPIDGHFMSNRFWNEEANRFETDEEFAQRLEADLRTSKEKLERIFGVPVVGFAYPFNDFGQQPSNFAGAHDIIAHVVPRVYEFAFYQVSADTDVGNRPGETMIKRIEPTADWSPEMLLETMQRAESAH